MAADKDKKKKRGDSPEEPIVRDKRRIDPETGEPRVNFDDADNDDADSADADSADADSAHAHATETHSDESAVDDSRSGENITADYDSLVADDGTISVDDDGAISDEDLKIFLENAQRPTEPASDHLDDLKRVQAEYANYRKRVDRDRYVARELAIAEVMAGILPVLDDLDLAHAHGDLAGSPLELVAQKIRTSFDRYGLLQVGLAGEAFDPKLHEAIAQIPSKDVTIETIADVVLPGYLLGERLLRAAKVAVFVPED
ncbi:MAG: nucleotide exchange factor GrpE [Terrimesophilobacter sp.]